MGDSRKAIADDEDYYRALCKKYNQTYHNLYTGHYNWIMEFDRGKTTLSWHEYERRLNINNKILKYQNLLTKAINTVNELATMIEELEAMKLKNFKD